VTPAARARYARYRRRRRERLGEEADKQRQRDAANKSYALHRAEIRDRAAARADRQRARLRKEKSLTEISGNAETLGGLSVVNEYELREPTFHSTGPLATKAEHMSRREIAAVTTDAFNEGIVIACAIAEAREGDPRRLAAILEKLRREIPAAFAKETQETISTGLQKPLGDQHRKE